MRPLRFALRRQFALELSVFSHVRSYSTEKTAPAESNQKLNELAKECSKLSLKEFTALQRQIFIELGYSKDFYEQALLRSMGGGGVAVAAAPAPAQDAKAAAPKAEAEEEPEAKEEKTSFDVKLVSFPPTSKVQLIKELRVVTQKGLMEAKQTIEKGGVIAPKLGKEDAEKLKALLTKHQAVVELV
uniref:Large ribosomal subunit protein bL12 C-terminal domain-containing protein n=1 Tax=Paramoeba aestuarina TaxID=180227 RepID=A0A7S4N404_9EUKA|eukprot:CAMPEP_0201516724 /NCGR_PEP_ID=MMETSP0161_2-20130828/7993_1 /ASSEMBLY_ACC=CAM_ASM_000251 /TAXON_ID=180227 /ORGANISM="Neoparamoeba aestuarina, Strain SoJaBio B1-5/56/2" /LENGTH=185 /DNA_ID=CAMNT_0047913975 /DNA_START=44 /DNA_END=601 /DNA_ORIENTATION=+